MMTALLKGNDFLERERVGRKQGVLITTFASLIIVSLSLPFLPWINIINPETFYAGFGIDDSEMHKGYSIFSFLSFVQNSRQGTLGFFAMMLLLLAASSTWLHIITIVRSVFSRYGRKGLLSFYTTSQAAMTLSFLSAVGTIGYITYSNNHFGIIGFTATFIPFIVLMLSAATYLIIKKMEKLERVAQRESGFLTELRRNWVLFLFLIPVAVYLLINNYLPMTGVYFAFTQFNFRDGLFSSPFVGFRNFEFLFMADLWRLTRNTVLYNIVFIGIGNVLQIFFAILISRVVSKIFKKTFQTMIFMPYFVSFVILSVLVFNLLEFNVGLVNSIITSLGGERRDFYNTPTYWPFFITFFFIWKNLGYGMVIYLATIMGINDEYYEAAKVDGASILQQIRYITLPQLKPTFIVLLLFALGSIMRGQFELFYQLVGNNGLLFNVTDIFDTYVYRITMFQPMSMGLGAAAGLFQSIFGFLVIVVTNFLIKRKNEEFALF
jgi:ABC-type polysaccharide transport system permease subunit